MYQLKSKKKIVMKDENGSVLLFSIAILFLLVVITTTIGLVVVNRANIVKASAEKSSVTAKSEQYLLSSENSINEAIYQNDELARYYMGMNYYENRTNNFNTSVIYNGNPIFDFYLRNLIEPTFQASVKAQYTPGDDINALKTIFSYITMRRSGKDITTITPNLLSIENVVKNTKTADGIYNVTNVVVSTKYSELGTMNQMSPKDYNSLYNHVNGMGSGTPANEILNIKYKGVHNTNTISKVLANITGDIVIAIYPIPYSGIGGSITTPSFDDISQHSIKVKEHRISQTGK